MQPLDASGTPGASDKPLVTREILAEAAVWVTRLHGPARSRAMELECLAWQAKSAAHRLAFERCTDTWQYAAGVQRAHIPAPAPDRLVRSAASRIRGQRLALVFAALGCAAFIAVVLWDNDTFSTGVGEQRLIVLADGSRVTLNTSTDVRVKQTDALRAVTVKRGEALFEVEKDPSRPFVVSVSDAKVVATGTAFLVRSTPPSRPNGDAFDVTLLEGRVVVERASSTVQSSLASAVVMAPGQRLRVSQAGKEGRQVAPAGTRLDLPELDSVLAWKRGVAVLDNVTLAEAIAEMNRYSTLPIRLDDSDAVQKLRVSGTYRTGDNEAFAHALAKLHGLVVKASNGELELAQR